MTQAPDHPCDVPVLPPNLESMRDPYPLLDMLLRGGAVRPIRTHQGRPEWLVSSYESVLAAVANPALSNDSKHARHLLEKSPGHGDQFDVFRNQHMLSNDPPNHTRLRRAVAKVFLSRNLGVQRERIQQVADGLLEKFDLVGRVDLVSEFARPLPVTVISDVLGVPMADRDRFQRLSTRVVRPITPDAVVDIREARAELWHYVDGLACAKHRAPEDDLLSHLVWAEDEGQLSRQETVATSVLLLVAGHETTVSLISGTVLELLRHGLVSAARQDKNFLVRCIEETLRYNGPVMHNTRYTAEDTDVLGVHIPQGNQVLLYTAAANHDPDRFTHPHEFDTTRTMRGGHLGFGHGLHYCVGAALARLEAETAVDALLQRLPDLTLEVPSQNLEWRPSFLRGLASLPLKFTPRARAM